ncbi:uncharacterized protein LOC142328342 [Lycorma delicatula]|uniref:uncharacterized protein LOC142328342 n=1 Tax=Lycorma delicatula TaxID=130591 RepID=UPI003F511FF5
MFQLVLLLGVVSSCLAIEYYSAPASHGYEKEYQHEPEPYDSHPKYIFEYEVKDEHTGDIKSQKEERDGDVVKGFYSLHEPDGTKRTVEYSADHKSGFNAIVHKEGTPIYPEPKKYESPKYETPKYEIKYEAPKYFETPKYEAPKYEAPKYEIKYEAPKYEAPKYYSHKPAYASASVTKYHQPKYEAPKYEAPKYEAPKYEIKYEAPKYYSAPKYEAPKYYSAPKYEAPKYYSAPKYEEPKVSSHSYSHATYSSPTHSY